MILTLEEVAEYLKVGRATIYRLLKRGEIPAFKVGEKDGGDWRFVSETIKNWTVERTLKQEDKREKVRHSSNVSTGRGNGLGSRRTSARVRHSQTNA